MVPHVTVHSSLDVWRSRRRREHDHLVSQRVRMYCDALEPHLRQGPMLLVARHALNCRKGVPTIQHLAEHGVVCGKGWAWVVSAQRYVARRCGGGPTQRLHVPHSVRAQATHCCPSAGAWRRS